MFSLTLSLETKICVVLHLIQLAVGHFGNTRFSALYAYCLIISVNFTTSNWSSSVGAITSHVGYKSNIPNKLFCPS